MKINKFFYLFALLFMALSMVSCSEVDDTEEEFVNWQNTNETYFNTLYSSVSEKIKAGDTSWKIIKNYSLPDESSTYTSSAKDHIVVEVLEEGTGAGCPLFTDSVRCHYSGRLLPSTSYKDGYVFDKSYYGTFNEATASPAEFVVSGLVDGFATALQNMHIGDSWRVYIPYQLGYGTSDSNSIPGYSTLIFDIKLVSYHRAGAGVPDFK